MINARMPRRDSLDPLTNRVALDTDQPNRLEIGDKTMRPALNHRRSTVFALLAPLATFTGVTTVAAMSLIGCGGTDVIDDDAGTIDTMDVSAPPDSTADTPGIEDRSVVDVRVDPADTRDAGVDVLDVSVGDADVNVDTRLDVNVEPDTGVPPDVNQDILRDSDVVVPDVPLPDVQVDSSDASTGPGLGAAAGFSVLGGSTVTNTGLSIVNGDLGVWPGLAVTGFPPGLVVGGTIDSGGPTSAAGQASLTTLYDTLKGTPCLTDMSSVDLSGKLLGPGVYCFSSSAALSTVGTLTLDAGGNPNAVWIFQIGSTLTTSDGSAVNVIGGGSACNVFWQVGESATIGKTNLFGGNIVALASITVMTGSSVSGRALARNGAVTLDTNNVAFTTCGGSTVDAGLDSSDGTADTPDASDGTDAPEATDASDAGDGAVSDGADGG